MGAAIRRLSPIAIGCQVVSHGIMSHECSARAVQRCLMPLCRKSERAVVSQRIITFSFSECRIWQFPDRIVPPIGVIFVVRCGDSRYVWCTSRLCTASGFNLWSVQRTIVATSTIGLWPNAWCVHLCKNLSYTTLRARLHSARWHRWSIVARARSRSGP